MIGFKESDTTSKTGDQKKLDKSEKSVEDEADEVEDEVVEQEATDEDPREHLNIVFIGHVGNVLEKNSRSPNFVSQMLGKVHFQEAFYI